jgi:methylase of polypeptide subunit release factors
LDQDVVQHEPHLALFADEIDGLSAYRQIATALVATRNAAQHTRIPATDTDAGAEPVRLTEDGFLVLEVGSGMWQAVSIIFEKEGLEVAEVVRDSRGMTRCIVLCWPQ